jgi:hypothetical protein
MDPLSLSITKRTEAIYIAIKEVCCLYAEKQMKDVFTIYNGPNTKITLNLPIQLDVCVWRKKKARKDYIN